MGGVGAGPPTHHHFHHHQLLALAEVTPWLERALSEANPKWSRTRELKVKAKASGLSSPAHRLVSGGCCPRGTPRPMGSFLHALATPLDQSPSDLCALIHRPPPPPSPAGHTQVDLALGLYSEEAYQFCKQSRVSAPRIGMAVRFATAPLRRYADLLAQRQLLAILRNQPAIGGNAVHR